MRAALHAHILCWFKPRAFRKDYKPIPAMPRTAPGAEPTPRPATQKVQPMKELQHDHVYQAAHVGPMIAELVRPDVSGESWGGYDLERLRIAGLARAVQTRLPYLHHCAPLYCLKNRAQCRFFFPTVDGSTARQSARFSPLRPGRQRQSICRWPYQPHQCYCENTERVLGGTENGVELSKLNL